MCHETVGSVGSASRTPRLHAWRCSDTGPRFSRQCSCPTQPSCRVSQPHVRHSPRTHVSRRCRLRRTGLTLMPLSGLSGTHLDAVGVRTNPADYLSGSESRPAAVSTHGPGSQYPHCIIHPELMRCGFRGGLGPHGRLFLELLGYLPRGSLLVGKDLLGVHSHAIT